jgi:hypothetical protein
VKGSQGGLHEKKKWKGRCTEREELARESLSFEIALIALDLILGSKLF